MTTGTGAPSAPTAPTAAFALLDDRLASVRAPTSRLYTDFAHERRCIDPRCARPAELDKNDMYRSNYEAPKLAIQRALANEPSVDELIANRRKIKHDMDDWS